MNAQALADTVEHMPAGGSCILDRALKLDAFKRCCTLCFVLVLCLAWSNGPRAQEVFAPPDELHRISARFIQEVTPQLAVPAQVLADYSELLEELLSNEGVPVTQPQFLLLVDRSSRVQAALLLWGAAGQGWHLMGAVPVSTGLPGKFEHFVTPLGVFAHSTENLGLSCRGDRNKLGFRGYVLCNNSYSSPRRPRCLQIAIEPNQRFTLLLRHFATDKLCLAFPDSQAGRKSVCCIEAVHEIEPIFDKREVSSGESKIRCHDDGNFRRWFV